MESQGVTNPRTLAIEPAPRRPEILPRRAGAGPVVRRFVLPILALAAGSAHGAATRFTLPLDVPTTVEREADPTQPFALVDHASGVFLYDPRSGRSLAQLPHLAMGGTIRGLLGQHDVSPVSPQLPPSLRRVNGWPKSLSAAPAGPPLLVDMNGDGRSELLVALESGEVLALDSGGKDVPGWPALLDGPLHDGPVSADVDADGLPEILVASGNGVVHALRANGRQEPPGWPVCLDNAATGEEIWAAPGVAAALDGRPLLALAGTLGSLLVVGGDGRPRDGWPVRPSTRVTDQNPPAVYASPSFADFEGDGRLEVLSGANDGRLSLIGAGGKLWPHWPIEVSGAARLGFGRVTTADLDEDGTIEILCASDRGLPGPARLMALRADRTPFPGWPLELPAPVMGGVAVADLDGAPGLEVVVATLGGDGQVLAFDSRGRALPGFPHRFPGVSFVTGPLLVDVDGNEGPEIVALGSRSAYGAGCSLIALDRSGHLLRGYPVELGSSDAFSGGLVAGDIDNDGHTDLVFTTGGHPEIQVFATSGLAKPSALCWPRSGRGAESPSRPIPPRELPPAAGPEPNPNPTPGYERLPLPDGFASALDPKKTISFVLHRTAPVRLEVIDVRGRRIRLLVEATMPPGLYALNWDGAGDRAEAVPSGVYFYQLWVEGGVETKQLVVLLR
ncbi:MAG: hypothetical protein U0527_13780 [Candidatus Eisenbacteria bacterium]